MKEIIRKVFSYCELRESVEFPQWMEEHGCDVYIDYELVAGDEEGLDEYLVENYPVEFGETIMIHIDY